MLLLRSLELGRVMESKFAPGSGALGLVPSCSARRTDRHALERADHGVSVKSEAGLGRCGQEVSFGAEIGASGLILKHSKPW